MPFLVSVNTEKLAQDFATPKHVNKMLVAS